ncbi:MAG TPA: septum formation initiator family protein [Candidatus Saccharimonadales bacterium]|nr:septum formation initiator family protein [Candidatus Saccharimonadales bacterium]
MQEKIKQYQKMMYEYAGDLRDVRVAGLVVFLVVVLLISWSGIKVIDTNYSLQKQITQLQQQNKLSQLEDNNLRLQNQYFNTNQYLDITARQEFGLAASGEKMLIVPTNVALAHTQNIPSLEQQTKAATVSHQPAYQRNFQAWMNFFLHRQVQ